jgi:hypothetical protein
VRPLEYRTTLGSGERKKGSIDITNVDQSMATVSMGVQAFRQVDDNGAIEFYDDPRLVEGIIPDFTTFELAPNETIRLFFVLDGTKLPTGDIFAALFATVVPDRQDAGIQTVRVGTLLSVVNQTPGPRQAEITQLSAATIQLGAEIEGSYTVRNTASSQQNTGFYPEVKVSLSPLGQSASITSQLVSAGRSRTVPFSLPSSQLGVFTLTTEFDGSKKSKVVFVATGLWKYVLILAVVVILGGLSLFIFRRRIFRRIRRSDKL